jgi:hypothetical protein
MAELAENKKELKFRSAGTMGSMIEIFYEGGGQVPEELTGLWTDRVRANNAIDLYRIRKEVKSGKTGGK